MFTASAAANVIDEFLEAHQKTTNVNHPAQRAAERWNPPPPQPHRGLRK